MNIVKVKILDANGEPAGRPYSYFTPDNLALGEIISVPVANGKDFPEGHMVKAAVVQINVPESEIAAFKDRVRSIPAKPEWANHRPDFVFEPAARDPEPAEPFPDNGGAIEPPDPSVPDEAAIPATPTLEGVRELTDSVLPPALVLLDKEVDPLTSAMNPELITAAQEATRLLEIAQGRTILSNDDLKPAADDLAIIRKGMKLVQEIRKRILNPYRTKVDTINKAFAEIIRPLDDADRITVQKVQRFQADQEKKTAEAKRIEDEKLKLAQDEAKLKDGEITVDLKPVEAPPPVPERVRTDLGTMGGRDNWKARVVDFKLLPDEYKIPDMTTLNAKAKSTKGTAVIPGVEFYNDRSVTIRTKN